MAENAENRLKFINCRHVVRVFTRSGPIADACKRRSPMFVLSAPLNGMLMATGDGAKDCEMARASFWLPDTERSIIWRYLDGVSLALANMFRLHLGPEGASIWDRVWTGDRYRMEEERVRRATRRLAEFGLLQASFPGGSRLIDLGCGSGDTLLLLGRTNKACTDLIGVDFSKEALSNAVSRLAETPTMLCRADAKYLPFETRSFTHLTAFGVLEHVTDVAAALAEMMRVVQPGGIIYITTSNCLSLLQIINAGRRITHRYPYGFQRNWTPDEIREVLSPWAAIEMLRIVHADWDMPFVRTVDAALRSAGWGRYIYIRCVRRQ